MDGPGDRELLQGCLDGDVVSWETFVRRFSRLIHWSIRRSVGDELPGGGHDFCREVFQEFFARLLEKQELTKLRDAENVRRFLVVSSSYLALDRLKAVRRRAKRTEALEELTLTPAAETLDEKHQRTADLRETMESLLSGLSRKERSCLVFSTVHGKTAAEIAGLLGLPENTVHSLLRRTKEKLKEQLQKKGWEGL